MTHPNDLANAWTQRGLALLQESSPDSLNEAIACFDSAIHLRQQLPLEVDPLVRFGLIAGWMNRAEALTRLGSPAQLEAALQSYAIALDHLALLPLQEHPAFRRRLAIAWLNRGITLQTRGTARDLAEAVHSFTQAITRLEQDQQDFEDAPLLHAAACMNRGNALLRMAPPQFREALHSARQAIGLITPRERDDLLAAEVSFKARHVFCQAVAQTLAATAGPGRDRDDLVAEATDAVDDGMKLARHWEVHGADQFRPLVRNLFRFGALAYQSYQPHFLAEYLLEFLDPEGPGGDVPPNPQMQATALEALSRACAGIQREGFRALHTPQFARVLEKVGDLRMAEARITNLKRSRGSLPSPEPLGPNLA